MMMVSGFFALAAYVLNIFLTLFSWLILARALISWVNPDPDNPIIQFLHRATEPILYPLRNFISARLSIGIDISPILAILMIRFMQMVSIPALLDLAAKF